METDSENLSTKDLYTQTSGENKGKKKKLHILQTLCSSPNLKSSIFTLDKNDGENKYGTWKSLYKLSTSNNRKTKNSLITFNLPLTTTSDLEFSLLNPTKHVELVTAANPASFVLERTIKCKDYYCQGSSSASCTLYPCFISGGNQTFED